MMNLGENIEKGVSLTLIRHCTPLDSRKNMGDTGGSASNSKIKPVDEFQNDSIKKCLQIWQRKVKVEFLKKYLEKKSQKFSIREIPGRFFFEEIFRRTLRDTSECIYIYIYWQICTQTSRKLSNNWKNWKKKIFEGMLE